MELLISQPIPAYLIMIEGAVIFKLIEVILKHISKNKKSYLGVLIITLFLIGLYFYISKDSGEIIKSINLFRRELHQKAIERKKEVPIVSYNNDSTEYITEVGDD